MRFIVAAATVGLAAASLLGARVHTVAGCVKDDQGAPLAGVTIQVEELEGLIKDQPAVDAKGCFKTNLPDGSYEVRAERNGARIAYKHILLDWRASFLRVELKPEPEEKAAPAQAPMVNLRMLASSSTLGTPDEAQVSSIAFNLPVVNAGDPALATVLLDRPAPAGGTTIRLAATNPALALIPDSVTVPAGSWSATFPVSTGKVRGPNNLRLVLKVGKGESALIIRSYTRLALEVRGTGDGRVVSVPPGISCSGPCTESFAEGTSLKLSAQPAANSFFAGFSGDCTQDGAVTITGPMHCVAEFSRK